MTSALSRCVGDVEAFTATYWARLPHHHPGKEGDFDDLLSLEDVDSIIATTAPRRPAIRLVREGAPLDPRAYSLAGRISGQRLEGLIDPGRVYDLFADGATVVLQSLQRTWAPLAQFCRALELLLTHPVQANAYLTPAGAAGLAPHHDTHDVFVLQIHGRKQWVVHQPLVEAPVAHQKLTASEASAQAVLFEIELTPGEVLYLPRGYVHSARAQKSLSLHVTLGVLAYTVADVLRDLIGHVVDADPRFRQSLAPGWADDVDGLEKVVAECAAALANWCGGADAATMADSLARRFWSGRRPLLEGQLQQLAGLEHITDDTEVRRRPGTVCRLEEVDLELRVLLGDREVVVPAAVGPAVRRLLEGAILAVGDLADLLDGPSRLVLVRRLVREGALVAVARG